MDDGMTRSLNASVTVYASAQEASREHCLLQRWAKNSRLGYARIQRRTWRAPKPAPGCVLRMVRPPGLFHATLAFGDLFRFLEIWPRVAGRPLDRVWIAAGVDDLAGAHVWLARSLLRALAAATDHLEVEFYFSSCEPRLHTIAVVQNSTGERWTHEDEDGELSPAAVAPLAACEPCTVIVGTRYQSGNAVVLPSPTLAALAAKGIDLCVRPDTELVRASKVISDAARLELERGGRNTS